MPSEEVRYGRARLTVETAGDLTAQDELGQTIDRYQAGAATPDEVAWAFVRSRVVSHSASFDWKEADLAKIGPLVTGVSVSPRIKASSTREFADELVRLRAAATPAAEPEPTPAPTVPAAAPAAASAAPTASPARTEHRGFVARTALAIGAAFSWLGRGLGRILPSRTIWRVALGLGVLLLIAGIIGANHYFSNVPDDLADDYRKKAQPAAEKVLDAMDRVYAQYDNYLDNSTLTRQETKNANEIEEIQRRFLPLYDDTEKALKSADKSIKKARKVIEANKEDLRGVPSAPLLDEKKPVVEAEETVGDIKDYLARAEAYLDNFERFVKYDTKALEVRREDVENLSVGQVSDDASLEEAKAALQKNLDVSEENRQDLIDLKPHPDQKQYHEYQVEVSTIVIDYFEDVLQAYEDLSLPQFNAADDEFEAELRGTRGRGSYLIQKFASKSSLQVQSRKLGKIADDLEAQIAGLGTGDGDRIVPDRVRDPLPPAPRKPSGGGGSNGGGDRSVS